MILLNLILITTILFVSFGIFIFAKILWALSNHRDELYRQRYEGSLERQDQKTIIVNKNQKKSIVNILSQILRNLAGSARVNQQIANLRNIREIVSYNQSNLANYTFLSSRKHKRLKTALAKYNSNNTQDQFDELKIAYDELNKYLEQDFRRVSGHHFTDIIEIFKKKSITTKAPRICIKGFIGDDIITLIRNEFTTKERDYPLGANTAFKKIMENKSYYFCDNIPLEIKKGAYKNARIREYDVINNYSSNVLRDLKLWLANKPDKEWQKCWRRDDNDELPRPDSCYKTTLVVPLSLPGDKGWISSEFIEHFRIGIDVPRTACFGFLCLDHQNVGYFKEQDIDMAYVIADFLSLYLIQKFACSSYSKAWNEADRIVNSNLNLLHKEKDETPSKKTEIDLDLVDVREPPARWVRHSSKKTEIDLDLVDVREPAARWVRHYNNKDFQEYQNKHKGIAIR